MSTAEVAAVMNDSDATVPAAVRAALPSIVAAIDGIVARMASGGRLIYVGAGSSGRLGVLDASECPPTFGTDPGDVVAIIAGGPPAIVSPVEAAEDDVDGGRRAIDDADGHGRTMRWWASRRAGEPRSWSPRSGAPATSVRSRSACRATPGRS